MVDAGELVVLGTADCGRVMHPSSLGHHSKDSLYFLVFDLARANVSTATQPSCPPAPNATTRN